jgi:hypothetical protein
MRAIRILVRLLGRRRPAVGDRSSIEPDRPECLAARGLDL